MFDDWCGSVLGHSLVSTRVNRRIGSRVNGLLSHGGVLVVNGHVLLGDGDIDVLSGHILDMERRSVGSCILGGINGLVGRGSCILRSIDGLVGSLGHVLLGKSGVLASILLEEMDWGSILGGVLVSNNVPDGSHVLGEVSNLVFFGIQLSLNVHKVIFWSSVDWEEWLFELLVPVWGIINSLRLAD